MKTFHLGFVGMALVAAACGGSASEETSSNGADESALTDARIGTSLKVTQTNLVSDVPGLAVTTDPNAVNVWGISFNPAGPAWVSNNGTGNDRGAQRRWRRPPHRPPCPPRPTSRPTRVSAARPPVRSSTRARPTSPATSSSSSPRTGPSPAGSLHRAVLHLDNSATGAVYKGVALGTSILYIADFHNDAIVVLDSTYKETTVAGGFKHPALPKGYAPFNVFVDGTRVFVAYAKQDKEAHDDAKGYGNGYIDLFDVDGNFESRLVSRGVLDSPWGMAIAPASFGTLAGQLLVGNTGNGFIHTYELGTDGYGNTTATLTGFVADPYGKELFIDNLWGLAISPVPDQSRLYFSAGPESESHGLYGRLDLPGTTSTDAGTAPDSGK